MLSKKNVKQKISRNLKIILEILISLIILTATLMNNAYFKIQWPDGYQVRSCYSVADVGNRIRSPMLEKDLKLMTRIDEKAV